VRISALRAAMVVGVEDLTSAAQLDSVAREVHRRKDSALCTLSAPWAMRRAQAVAA